MVILRELRLAGPVSQVELARATMTDPAALMRALDALERRGWVTRTSSEDDRRRKLVSLTPDGRSAVGRLDAPYEELRALANGGLSEREREQFCELAARVVATLNAAVVPALEEA